MNKDEMIKDIRAIIDDRCEAELGQVHAESKGGKVTKTVSTSLLAKDIYNANYRKIAEDEIVIKKSELGKVVVSHESADLVDMLNQEIREIQIANTTRQETAREILRFIDSRLDIRRAGIFERKIYFEKGYKMAIQEIKMLIKAEYGIELEEKNND